MPLTQKTALLKDPVSDSAKTIFNQQCLKNFLKYMLKTLLTRNEFGGGDSIGIFCFRWGANLLYLPDCCRISLQYFLSFSRQKSAKTNNTVCSLVLAPTCKLKTITFAVLSPYQWLVFLSIGSDSTIVEGIVDCIHTCKTVNCTPKHTYNFFLGYWNKRS